MTGGRGRPVIHRIAIAGQSKINNIEAVIKCVPNANNGGGTVTKEAANKKPWVKPELKRIGEINQVAGAQTPNSQAGNTKS